jgi:hypothetical protein
VDDPSDLSCKDGTRQHPVDSGEATHNRSVAGSRPASPTEQDKRALLCRPNSLPFWSWCLFIPPLRADRGRGCQLPLMLLVEATAT